MVIAIAVDFVKYRLPATHMGRKEPGIDTQPSFPLATFREEMVLTAYVSFWRTLCIDLAICSLDRGFIRNSFMPTPSAVSLETLSL